LLTIKTGYVEYSKILNITNVFVFQNITHNSFNVTLYNNVSMASNVHLEVPIICTYPSRITISTGYDPPGYSASIATVSIELVFLAFHAQYPISCHVKYI